MNYVVMLPLWLVLLVLPLVALFRAGRALIALALRVLRFALSRLRRRFT